MLESIRNEISITLLIFNQLNTFYIKFQFSYQDYDNITEENSDDESNWDYKEYYDYSDEYE
jgi:hypothetical protein